MGADLREPQPSLEDELDAWRDRSARVLLIALTLISMAPALYFTPAMIRAGQFSLIGYTLVAFVITTYLALSERPPYWVRATWLLMSLVNAGALAMLSGGDRAGGMASLMAVIPLALLLFSVRTGVVVAAAIFVFLVGCGFGFEAGYLPVLHTTSFELDNPLAWLGTATWMGAGVGGVIVTMSALLRRIEESMARRAELVDELRAESAERARALAELEATQAKLMHAQRLETIGLLAGGLAHDMNNALTVILGEAELLPEQEREASEQIAQAAGVAAQLTRQLLSFGRRDVVQPRVIELRGVLARAVKGVRRALSADIELEVELGTKAQWILADPNQIQQILFNLAMNARDAMAGGGKISITLDRSEDEVRLVVADTGSGMAPEVLAQIFEPFFTTKPDGQGTGLGLANVRDIVESVEGEIRATSELGVGTRFELCFPAQAELDDQARVEGSVEATLVHADHSVLVIEDDIRIRAVVVSTLEDAGYTVHEAGDGEAAIALIERLDKPLDLVWTDLVMPRLSAPDFLDWLEAHSPSTRVLLCSGYTNDEAMRRGIRAGRYPFLAKPFTREAARAACADAIEAKVEPIARRRSKLALVASS